MAQLQDFSPEQINEAVKWYNENNPALIKFCADEPEMRAQLYDVYFKLKMISIELRPNQFVIGVDYKGVTQEEYKKKGQHADFSKFSCNLSFWNPHQQGVADVLAKDILVSKLSTL